jgi:hypothetical protein
LLCKQLKHDSDGLEPERNFIRSKSRTRTQESEKVYFLHHTLV